MVQILLSSRFVPQDGGLSNHGSHHIWVHESVDVSCFMATSETSFISFTISRNVLFVLQTQLLDGLLDHFGGYGGFIAAVASC
ncbi:hypothetical protein Hdeb2414_s0023g00622401 [Helianthus debilis subsp. tardiflorus]